MAKNPLPASEQPTWIDAVFVGMIAISVIGLAYVLIHN